MPFFDLSSAHFYIQIAISIINGFVLCICSYKFLQIIQLTGYKLKGFFVWLKDTRAKYLLRLFMLSVISVVCLITINALLNGFIKDPNISSYCSYIGLIFYFYFAVFFGLRLNKYDEKVPVKYTHRMERLIGVLMFVSTIATFFIMRAGFVASAATDYALIGYALVAVTPILIILFVPIAFYLDLPYELLNYAHFINKAKTKLKTLEKNNNLIKIGVTGSFGKTTVKNILASILNQKYKVCISPLSYNTPMGITKTILKNLEDDHEVLICEMGARRKNDIKQLCDIVNPSYAILTSIGECHLASFKSVENIKNTKFELISSVSANKGFAVFGSGDDGVKELYSRAVCDKISTGIGRENAIHAENIKMNENGTSFDLYIFENKISVKTKLLGMHNVENILLAVGVANKLGLTAEQIKEGIFNILPVEHRLSIVKGVNNITILDDGYNSNIVGCRRALEVLSMFEGRKVVLTPGIVELGKKQSDINTEFGELIARNADLAIIVNLENQKALLKGLEQGGMKPENIFVVTNLNDAKKVMSEHLKEGDALLIENDLPDNYR